MLCADSSDFTEIWNDFKRTVSYQILTKTTDPMTGDETSSYASGFTATGGTITDVSGDKVHTFTSSGTFTTSGNIPNCEILIIGGGGAGGDKDDEGSGGGGSGGVVHGTGVTISSGSHTIVVGLGGTPVDNLQGNNGQDTSFDSIIAKGGGGGGSSSYYPSGQGLPGGSGGGNAPGDCVSGGDCSATGDFIGISNQPTYVGYTSYGNRGGYSNYGLGGGAGAGGGGAGEVGYNAPSGSQSGAGGNGLPFDITGTSIYYAGGGGGGYTGGGLGGLGGGGRGDDYGANNGTAGTDGLGGGGGGGSNGSSIGYAGGSGIVIIRYTPSASLDKDIIFFKENERWLFDKEGLTEVGDAYIMAPISDNIKRYDRFTIDNETYYIEAVYRRYVAQTAMHDFAVCFLVDK